MKKYLLAFLAGLLVAPALAEAPRQLSIFLNERPYAGKAIWYKDEVYVPLADMVRNLGGTFSFNHTTGVMNITLGINGAVVPTRGDTAPPGNTAVPASDAQPLVQSTFDHQILYSDNAKVSAIFKNNGEGQAHHVDVMCIFRNNMHEVIGTAVRFLGDLAPGESRSAEFWLFDPQENQAPISAYPAFGSGGSSVSQTQTPLTTIGVGSYRTEVQYEFKLNYK